MFYEKEKIVVTDLKSCVVCKKRIGNRYFYLSLFVRKPVFRVSDQVRHKSGCTVTEDGWRLEILYLGSRGIVLAM